MKEETRWAWNVCFISGTTTYVALKRTVMPEADDDVEYWNAVLVQPGPDGPEKREQLLAEVNLHPKWRQTVRRRYKKLDDRDRCPAKLVPLRS